MINTNKKLAACILITNSEGQVLGVSRRGEPDQWGLPGGKVDHGEQMIDGAIRETYEETGHRIPQDELIALFSDIDNHDYLTEVFYWTNPRGRVIVPEQMEEDMCVNWIDWADLINGPFSLFQTKLLRAFTKYTTTQKTSKTEPSYVEKLVENFITLAITVLTSETIDDAVKIKLILASPFFTLTKTSEDWHGCLTSLVILDPDGWDRNNYQFSYYKEKITLPEFVTRAMRSTCSVGWTLR